MVGTAIRLNAPSSTHDMSKHGILKVAGKTGDVSYNFAFKELASPSNIAPPMVVGSDYYALSFAHFDGSDDRCGHIRLTVPNARTSFTHTFGFTVSAKDPNNPGHTKSASFECTMIVTAH